MSHFHFALKLHVYSYWQGDGTASIFEDHPDVFTLSFHCQNNFPLRKQKSDLDVGLAVGTGDKEYLNTLAVCNNEINHWTKLLEYTPKFMFPFQSIYTRTIITWSIDIGNYSIKDVYELFLSL